VFTLRVLEEEEEKEGGNETPVARGTRATEKRQPPSKVIGAAVRCRTIDRTGRSFQEVAPLREFSARRNYVTMRLNF